MEGCIPVLPFFYISLVTSYIKNGMESGDSTIHVQVRADLTREW